jgi:NAD(P)-dependent dehydrogenase (short-subunit alcohol dehydrogenase family)
MSETFSGRVVLVTGGAGGIGRAIAEAFAAEGAEVAVTGLTEAEVEFGRDAPGELTAHLLDVADQASINRVVSRFKRLDVLVNAAGMILRDGLEFEPDDFLRVVDVNLVGTMRMCRACQALLEDGGGSIINLASVLSLFGSGFVPAYSASKGGVAQLTKSLAIAWAAKGIRVNAIAPGWIETALTKPLIDDPTRSGAIVARTPLGRWGRPADVAGAVLFLCSPAAAFITGVVLPIDGGYSIA